MKYLLFLLLPFVGLSCKQAKTAQGSTSEIPSESTWDFTLVFASCSDQDRPQPLWEPIVSHSPDLFIWGGDNIYADTKDMDKMKADYDKVLAHPGYQKLMESTTIIGTWDDHDYGKNDAGSEWPKKEEAKQLFLDFLKVPEDDDRYQREGVYSSYSTEAQGKKLKFILLDTRTFRDSLLKSTVKGRRYEAWPIEDTTKTILGEAQWQWLKGELADETADFTIIVTSIQYLNDRHGWERWGNMPAEAKKLEHLIYNAKAKNIFLLSGDRHMAEVSRKNTHGLSYPLIDFTTSGMTHTWITNTTESNPYRISNVVKRLNFGVIRFDLDAQKVAFEIRGEDNFLYERHDVHY
ncbi:alkaline phosphatase D family protein [Aureisphaera galaxeae]|uniref:alkaline phosphatase D family protein n=1 Tax=Aureisphaera galaxeae TaxID=1538023 RepID=UPI00234FC8CB|nr:alkaline phosphatase D family protein [Aureisphaera galaxeae]MDC8003474.1 alkaline phosphatase D family protein [Aureisphaera galaxeae]